MNEVKKFNLTKPAFTQLPSAIEGIEKIVWSVNIMQMLKRDRRAENSVFLTYDELLQREEFELEN